MELTLNISILLGSVISLLLSVIAYFIKQLHADFRKMEKDVTEVKSTTQVIRSEFRAGSDLIGQRVGFLEQRLEFYERLIFKKKNRGG